MSVLPKTMGGMVPIILRDDWHGMQLLVNEQATSDEDGFC